MGDKRKRSISYSGKSSLIFYAFENIILSYQELLEIINDPILYENWHLALSSVYGIYLITDKTDGKHYVGSDYGSGGLLERWKCYIETKHSGNKKIVDLLKRHPEQYNNFRFSILQILPKTLSPQEVIETESLYKNKLLSREFGLNDN